MDTLRVILAAGSVAVIGGYLLLAWRRARERRRRWRLDLCRECGYDLRGSGERCPECGAKIVRDPKEVGTMTIKDDRR